MFCSRSCWFLPWYGLQTARRRLQGPKPLRWKWCTATEKTFLIRTDAETLRRACEEQNLIAGTEGEYGLYVLTVDGETADESIQQWWCITKGGEEHFYGVDDTMILDGEQYEFTLKTGW